MDIKDRLIKKFKKSVARLEEGVDATELPADFKRDTVLMRFELVAEIAPKVLKRILEERGAAPFLPKDIVRSALSGGIISESVALVLLQIIDDRNRMVHDYNESYADDLYEKVMNSYVSVLRELALAL